MRTTSKTGKTTTDKTTEDILKGNIFDLKKSELIFINVFAKQYS